MLKSVLTLLFAGILLCSTAGLTQTRRSGGLAAPHPNLRSTPSSMQMQRSIPQGDFNRPVYNPYFSIYFGPLYEPYDEPCHYDEIYGQWIGPCDAELSSPGYSRTIPNRIR
jgi:hypothetical protein